MRAKARARIHPLGLHLDDHSREIELPLLDFDHLVQGEPPADTDRHERVGRNPGQPLLEFGERNAKEDAEAGEDGLPVLHLAGDQREGEGGAVVHQRQPVPVEKNSARSDDGADADPVLLRGLAEAMALEHLKIPELAQEEEEPDDRTDAQGDEAPAERLFPALERNRSSGQRHGSQIRLLSTRESPSTTAAPTKPL